MSSDSNSGEGVEPQRADPNLTSAKWWHLAFSGVALLVTIMSFIDPAATRNQIQILAVIWLTVLVWFSFGRKSFSNQTIGLIFKIFLVVVLFVGIYFYPSYALVQALVYPFMWSSSASLKKALFWNFVTAFAAGFAFYFVLDGNGGQIFAAAGIALLSFTFSVVMGLWITKIVESGEERDRLLAELTESQDKLAQLNHLAGVASERERLSREIHDTVAQSLAALVMMAERAKRELNDPQAQQKTLQLIEETAKSSLAETRGLVAALAPVELESSGLQAALNRLSQRFHRETEVKIELSFAPGSFEKLSRDQEVVLLRAFQEALANIRKHSGASRVVISSELSEQSLLLRILDNGKGLELDTEQHLESGFGLRGLAKRLELIDGELSLESVSGSGLGVVIEIPLVERSENV